STGVLAIDPVRNKSATITVRGLDGRDTEALAVGRCGPRTKRSCLFIGDIGNNQGAWPSVRVWRVREPDLRPWRKKLTVDGTVATYTYPGRPVNAEALLVEDGRPYLITKEPREGDRPSRRPRLLGAERFGDGQLRNHGRIRLPKPRSGGWAAALYGNVVT